MESTTIASGGPGDTDVETFATRAEEWLQKNVPTKWRDNRNSLSPDAADEIRREWDRQLWRGGYAGLSLPVEFGGQGLGLAEEVAFHVLAASAQAPDGLARVGKILTAPTLIAHGTPEQRERYLPRILSGEEIWCQGFSEPGAGSDLAGVRTRAEKVDGGFLVSGRKTWTSFAQHADRCLLVAVTEPDAPRHRNLGMLLLDMKQPGVVVSGIKQISGGTHFAEVSFDRVFVSDDDIVLGRGDGWKVAMTVLTNERGGVEAATRYVEVRADMDMLERALAGRPEYRLQLEELETRVELLRWQIAKAVDREDDEPRFARSASVLKVLWSELWQDVSRLAAAAMLRDDRDHWRFQYLESKGGTIYSGTNEIQRNIMAERILGLPR